MTNKSKESECYDCNEAARLAYSDATTPGFFSPKCSRHSATGATLSNQVALEDGRPICWDCGEPLDKEVHQLCDVTKPCNSCGGVGGHAEGCRPTPAPDLPSVEELAKVIWDSDNKWNYFVTRDKLAPPADWGEWLAKSVLDYLRKKGE